MHHNNIKDFIIYNERFVFSNCTDAKVYHWEIQDVDNLSGKPETTGRALKDSPLNYHAHDSSKPYSAFIYDQQHDLFVGCMAEK